MRIRGERPRGFLLAVSIIGFVRFFQQTPDSIMMAWGQEHRLQLSFLGCYLAMLAYHAWRGNVSLATWMITW